MALSLRLRGPSGTQHTASLSGTATFADLRREAAREFALAEGEVEILLGFPPALCTAGGDSLLSSLVKSGESVTVRLGTAGPGSSPAVESPAEHGRDVEMDLSEGVLRVGLIADIQYADADDGSDFSGHEQRHFRNALKILESAVALWNAQNIDVVVNLGDAIDGRNAKAEASESAWLSVFDILARVRSRRRIDLLGNHELYNFKRDFLQAFFALPGETFYHSSVLSTRWEALVLDPFEIALVGYPEDHPCYLQAQGVMKEHNPGVLDESVKDWFTGLPQEKHRYVPFNGGVSDAQLAWLVGSLAAAKEAGRSVLLFSHVPLYHPATKPKTILWNCEDVLRILSEYASTVVAVFAGHDHDGGYAVDPAGIHHVTMNSPLTADVGNDCFAVLECYDGWARMVSYGRACVESSTGGKGKAYAELMLAKGAENLPG